LQGARVEKELFQFPLAKNSLEFAESDERDEHHQVQAWEKRDFAIAADDWLPNGELFSFGGHVVKKDMQSAILDYFKNFTDLKVTVKVHVCPLSPGTGRRSGISLLASQISRLSGSDNGREAGGVFSDARGSDVVPGIGLGHATRPV
jgi:hypothetical protein